MITTSPVGLATTALVANQVSLLVEIKEKLCKSYCINSYNPLISVTYSYSTPILNSGTVFVPITAVVTVVNPGSCCNNTQIFAETFTAAFQGQTALPTSVEINSVGRLKNITGTCKSNQLSYQDSITVLIS